MARETLFHFITMEYLFLRDNSRVNVRMPCRRFGRHIALVLNLYYLPFFKRIQYVCSQVIHVVVCAVVIHLQLD